MTDWFGVPDSANILAILEKISKLPPPVQRIRVRREAYAYLLATVRTEEAKQSIYPSVSGIPIEIDDSLTTDVAFDYALPERPRYDRLEGHNGIEVVFLEPVISFAFRDDRGYHFGLPELNVRAIAPSADESSRRVADRLAAETLELTRAFADDLTEEQMARKLELLRYINPVASKLGIDYPTERLLVGTIQRGKFVPTQVEFEPLSLAGVSVLEGLHDGDACWARVATGRDGVPTGEVLELEKHP